MDDFVSWLNAELNQRGWNYAELARRSGISASMISRVVSGYNTPGLEFCKAMARALRIDATYVLTLAGHLPSRLDPDGIDPEDRATMEQLHAIWRRLKAVKPEATRRLQRIAILQAEMVAAAAGVELAQNEEEAQAREPEPANVAHTS